MTEATNSFSLLKLQILAALCFLTAGTSLLVQYSRTVLHETYSTVEVILMAEVFKVIISGYLSVESTTSLTHTPTHTLTPTHTPTPPLPPKWYIHLWRLFKNGKEMFLLVVLYTISNISGFNACALIGAAWHSVLVQLKILTTAVFAVCFLQRKYSSTKWRALILLLMGAVLVTSPVMKQSKEATNDQERSDAVAFGVVLVLTQATISGFSSVYFERVLKKEGPQPNIWERNFQLAAYSVLVLSLTSVAENINESVNHPENVTVPTVSLFKGWSVVTVLITVMSGSTGLVIAATLKYADAVLKCLATSCAIIVTSIVGYFFFHTVIDVFVAIGMVTVIIAVFNYTLDATPADVMKSSTCDGDATGKDMMASAVKV